MRHLLAVLAGWLLVFTLYAAWLQAHEPRSAGHVVYGRVK